MGPVQVVATIVAALITITAIVLAVRAVRQMVGVIRLGQPVPAQRFDGKGQRTATMLRETLGHTRMLKWSGIGFAHWFVMMSFIVLFLLVVEAYFDVVSAEGKLPLLGGWAPYGLVTEWLSVFGLIAILALITVRLMNRPTRKKGLSRFTGSTMWQAYYVEYTIVGVLICGLLIRSLKFAAGHGEYPAWATPVTYGLGLVLPGSEAAISLVAMVKLIISMAWLITISLNITMGVAWHRFSAFFNIFFKRSAGPAPALGALRPMMSEGKPLDFEEADPEKDQFGVAQVEQFTWKGLLDFSTCTECGRCQSQCPAWNTGKPLSPKLLVLSLRDHAYAKAPYLLAGGGKDLAGEEKGTAERLATVDALALAEAERPLIGGPEQQGVIDPDVLWSCTTCGACVEQCPVDIEHVDHIVDMRRYQVLIEAEFPTELGTLFRNLENKGNPWGQNPSARMDWAKGLDFEVPRLAEETLPSDVEYLFWIGCAGAFDDNAKRTVRATAELLHHAGVDYVVLGDGETCTGDPARRSGNEFVFQMLAQQNVETLNTVFEGREPGRRKIVTTCPHCFNTLGREYPQLEGHYEVVHHTQLLNQLVREGRLIPVPATDGPAVTYHDPCYLGRHNEVYSPPRELVGASGAQLTEMPRHAERSMCCGAGGARMWMEERIGKRVNLDRVDEAIATEASTIATGCPFCRVMLTDGLTTREAEDTAGHTAEVLDVAQLLLASVKRGKPTPPTGSE
jgi:Fe-S oxidoreductase